MTEPEFVPTPEEIAAATVEIRSGWSESERLQRMKFTESFEFVRPEVRQQAEEQLAITLAKTRDRQTTSHNHQTRS